MKLNCLAPGVVKGAYPIFNHLAYICYMFGDSKPQDGKLIDLC